MLQMGNTLAGQCSLYKLLELFLAIQQSPLLIYLICVVCEVYKVWLTYSMIPHEASLIIIPFILKLRAGNSITAELTTFHVYFLFF